MKNKKDKSDAVPRNERGMKSTKARTAGGKKLNPEVQVVPVSAKTGDNLDAWLAWLA